LFINEVEVIPDMWHNKFRHARPSSKHPGGVVAVFCDGHFQFLRDNMDKTLFVRLCRPGNAVILNPKDLD
jgi:prepilin-type processing-associated H-X9-DG protein